MDRPVAAPRGPFIRVHPDDLEALLDAYAIVMRGRRPSKPAQQRYMKYVAALARHRATNVSTDT